MKATQGQMIRAYGAIRRLTAYRLDSAEKALRLWRIWKAAEAAYEFQAAEERKLIEQYHGEADGESTVRFRTPEDAESYRTAQAELGEVEIGAEIVPVRLSDADLEQIRISAEDIDRLTGLVIFPGTEDNETEAGA